MKMFNPGMVEHQVYCQTQYTKYVKQTYYFLNFNVFYQLQF